MGRLAGTVQRGMEEVNGGNVAFMKTLLICHEGAILDQEGMLRWLASFSQVVGVVILREQSGRKLKRVKREIVRVGTLRFLDVCAFRLYYRLFIASKDRRWERSRLEALHSMFPPVGRVPMLVSSSPNSEETEGFIKRSDPDIVIARCKVILNRRIFSIARNGTFVMHPGICPEYRNAHGCFWALANGDFEKVGMTLLKVDAGVDTGGVFGYYTYPYDSRFESHVVIQHRVVFDNLLPLQRKLLDIHEGRAEAIDTSGRASREWGHPWLSRYVSWKRRAMKEGR